MVYVVLLGISYGIYKKIMVSDTWNGLLCGSVFTIIYIIILLINHFNKGKTSAFVYILTKATKVISCLSTVGFYYINIFNKQLGAKSEWFQIVLGALSINLVIDTLIEFCNEKEK